MTVERDHYTPGPATSADVTVHCMFYTLCAVCRSALNDWSDTRAEAARNRQAHLDWHKRNDKKCAHRDKHGPCDLPRDEHDMSLGHAFEPADDQRAATTAGED